MRREAFAHENNSGNIVPALKFTARIEEHAIRLVGFPVHARLAGKRNTQPQRIQLCSDFPQPFDMARRNAQPPRPKLLTQAQTNRSQNFLLTTMRATAELYRAN